MKLPHPKLLVLSAPSGTGKSTIIKALLDIYQESLLQSVSYTTRPARPGEEEGIHYHFVSKDAFVQRIHQGDFLEWAEVHGNYYGTSKSQIQSYLDQGKAIILDIDVQGALQLMEQDLDGEFIFLSPPNLQELENRLRGRKTETEENIQIRLNNAKVEMETSHRYQHQLINENLDRAILDFAILILQLCGETSFKINPELNTKANLEEFQKSLKSFFWSIQGASLRVK